MEQIEALARRVPGLALVVVDYVGKVSPSKISYRNSDRYNYMTEVSGDLKTMARSLRLPVLVLCQLNRASEGQKDKRPGLANLRDTGALEQDADGVIFLYREAYYNPEGRPLYEPEPMEVILEKNRHGPTGSCELAFSMAVSKVTAISNDPRDFFKRSRFQNRPKWRFNTMRTFAIVNRKGGVGKTTTAVNLAYVLATSCHLRVLLVDADGQANATQILLPRGEYAGLGALLRGYAICYDELTVHTDVEGLDVLPASEDLWALDLEARESCRYSALMQMRDAVEEDGTYDVMIVDCPPNLSAACVSAILASDAIIIPVLSDACSATGVADLVEQIDSLRYIRPDIRVAGVLVNQWHRSPVVEDAADYLREDGRVPVYDTVIRRTDKVPESSWARMAVQQWSPWCSAARDYRAWTAELLAKEGMKYE